MKKAAKSVKLVVAINRKVADAEEQAVRVSFAYLFLLKQRRRESVFNPNFLFKSRPIGQTRLVYVAPFKLRS